MIEILHTEDGSTTLFVKELDETYHSKFGAITESEHVFIQTGFHYLSGHCQQLNIFEVGFGTGLNALLTYYAAKNTRVNYFTLETHPISLEIVSQLNYPTLIAQKDSDQIFRSLHSCDWDTPVRISKSFVLHKILGRIEDVLPENNYFNLFYFDAFGPDVQPGLWTVEIFAKLFRALQTGGILVTYAAKGEIRRNLKFAGFEVERLPGPPGKRHITRAIKA